MKINKEFRFWSVLLSLWIGLLLSGIVFDYSLSSTIDSIYFTTFGYCMARLAIRWSEKNNKEDTTWPHSPSFVEAECIGVADQHLKASAVILNDFLPEKNG